jgi:hypothetical protein
MSISAGSYTIGTGGDYANLYAFFAALANLTNDIVATIISDITETQTINPTIQLNGFALIITSNKPPKGKLGEGWKVNRNFSGNMLMLQFSGTGTGGTCKISGFELKALAATGNGYDIYFYEANNTQKYYCHDIVFNGNSQGSVPIGSNFTTTNGSLNIWNCISYKTGYGFYLPCDGKVYIENCISAYNTATNGFDFFNKPNITSINNVGIGNYNLDFNRTANATGYNNASADNSADGTWGTKSGNINAITAADQFVDPANGDFALTPTATFRQAGHSLLIAENQKGANYYSRVAPYISISAFEVENGIALWEADTSNNLLLVRDVVFVGDSITYNGGDWAIRTGMSSAKNRGISGDTTAQVLERINEVYRIYPKRVFLLVGINDISASVPDATIISNILSIVDSVFNYSPTSKIYVQSILPASTADWRSNITNINASLAESAVAHNYTFVNLYPSFADGNNYIISAYTTDGTHLSEAGYDLWTSLESACYVIRRGIALDLSIGVNDIAI